MTYSIIGVNTATGELGGAGASCLEGGDVYVIYGGIPGRGVVHAQARYSTVAQRQAVELLAQGYAPAEIVSAITQKDYDPDAAVRQYGILDVLGNSAGFTGEETTPYAEDRQGQSGTFSYSVQGNILTSARVLDQAASAFETSGCDLAERLMAALEAGAEGGEGDSRCMPQGIPSDSAFLRIEPRDEQAGVSLSLRVTSSGSASPLPQLREQLDSWRASHPCPVEMTPGSAGAPPTVSQPGATIASDAGCSCRTQADADSTLVSLLLGFLLVAGRRRQTRRPPRQLHPIQAP